MQSKIAENFILSDQYGNKFELYKNSERYILLIFYPKDNSFICSKQLRNYQMNIEKFKKLGIQPVGINIESIDSHKSFCDLKSIDFPMLSDNEKIVSKKYNALNIFSSNKRKLVLINLQREIVYERDIFTLNYLKTEEILTGLKKLNII